MNCRALAAAALCFISLPAVAQEDAGKPFRLQTALDLPDWLKLSASIRPRYETLENQFVAGRTGSDELLGMQSVLKAEIDANDFAFVGEIVDARRLIGNDGGGAPAEVDALEPVQIFAAWRPKDFLMKGASLDVSVGRFTMDVGSRRLVARSGFRNIVSSFDGVRGAWSGPGGVKVMGFYTAPTTREPTDIPSALDNEIVFNPVLDDVRFGGWHAEAPLPMSFTGEVYLIDLDEDDGDVAQTRNRDLSTGGFRLRRAPRAKTWDFEIEYAHQTGSVRSSTNPADITDLDHNASMLHAEAGWTLDAPWSPRLSVHYDLASGDDSPGDLASERFDPLFGDRSFEFGPTSIYGAVLRSNLDSPGVRIEARPNSRNELMGMVRQVKLESATDSFANSSVRDPAGASGDDVGTQVELRWRHQVVPDSVRLSLGGTALIRGDFLKTAPNATLEGDTWYGYTELLFSF
ncbi:MAG TPA: alginate export family protein [Hyphomonadaceae bacterium]